MKHLSLFALSLVLLAGGERSAAAFQLSDFVLHERIDRLELPPADDAAADFSGVAYVEDGNGRQRILIIDNKTTDIYQYDLEGRYQRTIPTSGFVDTEGIVYLGKNRFAIVEERNTQISVVTIDAKTGSLDKAKDAQIIEPHLDIDGSSLNPEGGNAGLEGIAYDKQRRLFYVVKEKKGRKLFGVAETGEPGKATPLDGPTNALKTKLDDFADVFFDQVSKDFFVLSQESNRIARVGLEGPCREILDIPGRQPEGLAFSPDGKHLFIVGEPREYFHFLAQPSGRTLREGTSAGKTLSDPTRPKTRTTGAASSDGRDVEADSRGTLSPLRWALVAVAAVTLGVVSLFVILRGRRRKT